MSNPLKGWNYASSAEQQREEFARMYRSLTDPEEKKRLKMLERREARRAGIAADTGL